MRQISWIFEANSWLFNEKIREMWPNPAFPQQISPKSSRLLSTLDSDIDIKPDAHVFTQFKAPWHEIEDELPQFAKGRCSPE